MLASILIASLLSMSSVSGRVVGVPDTLQTAVVGFGKPSPYTQCTLALDVSAITKGFVSQLPLVIDKTANPCTQVILADKMVDFAKSLPTNDCKHEFLILARQVLFMERSFDYSLNKGVFLQCYNASLPRHDELKAIIPQVPVETSPDGSAARLNMMSYNYMIMTNLGMISPSEQNAKASGMSIQEQQLLAGVRGF
jgi:hypothetical protein